MNEREVKILETVSEIMTEFAVACRNANTVITELVEELENREDRLEFITNIYDPTRPDAWVWVVTFDDKLICDAHENQRTWLADKVIGEPKGTESYSSEELSKMGFAGVYKYKE